MAGKKGGENTKKASGNAQKAEAAAAKAAAAAQAQAAVDADDWGRGAKSSAKKYVWSSFPPPDFPILFFRYSSHPHLPSTSPNFHTIVPRQRLTTFRDAEAAKKAEAARKKVEKDALLAEEEKSLKAAPKASKAAKPAAKKAHGLDLNALDDDSAEGSKKTAPALHATGIDNALDALSLTASEAAKVDKHPERRFKAAHAAYEERRLKEMEEDGTGQGLRQNQKKEKIRKEFERHEDNPFNQVNARYDASKDEVRELAEKERMKIESRLARE
jgi:hypothetical protein